MLHEPLAMPACEGYFNLVARLVQHDDPAIASMLCTGLANRLPILAAAGAILVSIWWSVSWSLHQRALRKPRKRCVIDVGKKSIKLLVATVDPSRSFGILGEPAYKTDYNLKLEMKEDGKTVSDGSEIQAINVITALIGEARKHGAVEAAGVVDPIFRGHELVPEIVERTGLTLQFSDELPKGDHFASQKLKGDHGSLHRCAALMAQGKFYTPIDMSLVDAAQFVCADMPDASK